MHTNQTYYTLPAFLNSSFLKYPDNPFLGYTDEQPMTYADVQKQVNALMRLLENLGVVKGDRVALLSSNMPNWGVAYFAITCMGAVVVPILPEFSADEVRNVLHHSESKVIFVSDLQLQKIEGYNSNTLHSVINISSWEMIQSEKTEVFSVVDDFLPSAIVEEDDLAALIYTSGTTGNPKGVMLSHKNITFNAVSAGILQPINQYDRFLSLLPLSHTYENTLGLILPMQNGAAVYYLKKLPTPNVLIPAMQHIKPTLILSVPLIIEKIYRNKILPSINGKSLIRNAYKLPFVRRIINKSAGQKLMQTFGGHLKFFGIGGSKLDSVIEQFLIEAKFPYAIGYGLTETSPLLAGVNPQMVRHQSTGPAVQGVQLKLDHVNPETGEGEILAKGPNVMKGYYKDPKSTSEVFTLDGWFKTGDLASIDKDGFVFIKGRLKNVIIGPGGENIYPEEIEALINNFQFVAESLVIEQKGKLVAFVHFNMEELEKKYQNLKGDVKQYIESKQMELSDELKNYINSKVNSFSSIKAVVVQPFPFEKTATQKIKRYKYM